MQNDQISMQTFLGNASFLKGKAIPFLKQSFLIPFIFATILYILMRVFFIGSEFELTESIELYVQTFFVTWSYINAWRLLCVGIVWIESKTNRVKLAKIADMRILKKTAILILAAGLTYTIKANASDRPAQKVEKDTVTTTDTDAVNEIDAKFYFWMKG